MNISKLTQAGHNRDTLLEEDIHHFRCNHGVEVVNLLRCPGNLVIIIVTCKDNLR
jgi:hypothetical protein